MSEQAGNFSTEAGAQQTEPALKWLAFLGMPMVWAVPFLILTAVTGFVFIPGFFFAPFSAFFVVYAVYRAVTDSRRRNGQIIVSYLDTAVRLNLPLIPFLIAAERSETGRRRRQIQDIWRTLESGAPVAIALRFVPDVQDTTKAQIAASEPLGQLRQALAEVTEDDLEEEAAYKSRREAAYYRFYQLFLGYALVALGLGFWIFVVPKFREIFKDFRTPLPWITEKLFNLAGLMEDNWPLVAIGVFFLSLGTLVVVSYFLNRIFLPSLAMPKFGRLYEWFAWRLPVLRGMERDKGMAEACRLISDAMRCRVPLPAAIERATVLRINTGFRRQLAEFREGLISGKTAGEAAAQARMPELLVGMLAPLSAGLGESGGDLFEFMARYYRQRFSRTMMLILAASEPLIVLAFGALVLVTVLALFEPLVALLRSVYPQELGGAL